MHVDVCERGVARLGARCQYSGILFDGGSKYHDGKIDGQLTVCGILLLLCLVYMQVWSSVFLFAPELQSVYRQPLRDGDTQADCCYLGVLDISRMSMDLEAPTGRPGGSGARALQP